MVGSAAALRPQPAALHFDKSSVGVGVTVGVEVSVGVDVGSLGVGVEEIVAVAVSVDKAIELAWLTAVSNLIVLTGAGPTEVGPAHRPISPTALTKAIAIKAPIMMAASAARGGFRSG